MVIIIVLLVAAVAKSVVTIDLVVESKREVVIRYASEVAPPGETEWLPGEKHDHSEALWRCLRFLGEALCPLEGFRVWGCMRDCQNHGPFLGAQNWALY